MTPHAEDHSAEDQAAPDATAEAGRKRGSLYVVATPIGNLGDITSRALETLQKVVWVAAEDTRLARQLLSHFGLATPVLAIHLRREREAAERVCAELLAGKDVALISDAGTPAVSDPGSLVVTAAREAGCRVAPIPGASAVVAAVSVAGFGETPFLFHGFLPSAAGPRREELRNLAALPVVLVFYEAPHRIVETAEALAASLGAEREIVLARELTKRFEQIHRCPIGAAKDWLLADPDRQRGEFVLVVGPPAVAPGSDDLTAQDLQLLEALLTELPPARAAKLAAKIAGGKRDAFYAAALAVK